MNVILNGNTRVYTMRVLKHQNTIVLRERIHDQEAPNIYLTIFIHNLL